MSQSLNRFPLLSLACAAGLLLGGCGANDALVITGTAAKGAPLAGTVAATCASGSGTATVQSDGSYRVEVADGAGPCLLKLTPSGGGTPLYSFTTGTGSSVVSNITPLTNAFVTYLINLPGAAANSATPEVWFSKAPAQQQLKVTAEIEDRAFSFLDIVRSAAGLTATDLPSNLGFLSTSFVANPVSSVQDKALELLAGKGTTASGSTPTKIIDTTGTPTATFSSVVQTSASSARPVLENTPDPSGAGS